MSKKKETKFALQSWNAAMNGKLQKKEQKQCYMPNFGNDTLIIMIIVPEMS